MLFLFQIFVNKATQDGGIRDGVRGGGLRQSPLPDRQGCHRQHGVSDAL